MRYWTPPALRAPNPDEHVTGGNLPCGNLIPAPPKYGGPSVQRPESVPTYTIVVSGCFRICRARRCDLAASSRECPSLFEQRPLRENKGVLTTFGDGVSRPGRGHVRRDR